MAMSPVWIIFHLLVISNGVQARSCCGLKGWRNGSIAASFMDFGEWNNSCRFHVSVNVLGTMNRLPFGSGSMNSIY